MPQQRHALIIGIDEYPHLTPLDGCVNDALLIRSILEERFQFPRENIAQLLDGEATREAILREMDALVERVGDDDIVVIQFAGHGSQMTDREGDEPDGLDETIMPFDTEGWRGDNRDISDDEIHLRLLALAEKTSYTTFIVDACHSGTITRDPFGAKGRAQPPDTRPVEELPPSPIPREMWGAVRSRGPSGWVPLDDSYVLMAGCRDDEISYEYAVRDGEEWVMHGAMTYFLSQELLKAGPGTTYRDVFERVQAKVNANNQRQHPQIEGRLDREIFGVADVVPTRFVRVTKRSGQSVTLAAGLAHGVTKGSSYAVYPQGTRTPEGSEPLGQLEIRRVRSVESEARIVSESAPDAIVPDSRAFQTEHAYGGFSLAIEVVNATDDPSATRGIEERIRSSALLEVTPQHGSLRVYALPQRTEATEADPVPQLGALDAPSLVAVDGTGGVVISPKPLAAIDEVGEALERLARYRQLLELENPDPDNPLRGRFQLDLLRRDSSGSWVVAEAEDAGGHIVFEEGDELAIRIGSAHHEPIFVSVLDFGLTGAITQVFPRRGGSQSLEPNQSFDIGGDAPFEVSLPSGISADFSEGVETVKVFLTDVDTDLSTLEQTGVRSTGGAGGDHGLAAVLDAAARGGGTRDLRAPVTDRWLTLMRPFLVRRRNRAALGGQGATLNLGGVEVVSDGFQATVSTAFGASGRVESQAPTPDAVGEALGLADMAVQDSLVLENGRVEAARSPTGPSMEISVPPPRPGMDQVILATDDNGYLSWHFHDPVTATRGARDARVTYTIPVGPRSRGLIASAGIAALKILVFPHLEKVAGAAGKSLADWAETRARPYRVRSFTPDDYDRAEARSWSASDWESLRAGPGLLFVHGTFGTAHGAFGDLPRSFVEEMHRRYEGRVLAFDHPSLSFDPVDNVRWLVDQIPPGVSPTLDILCHSRGGIVSRVLSEMGDEVDPEGRVRVRRIAFVGSPNGGTGLADGKKLASFLDTYTNLFAKIPGPVGVDAMAVVLALVKQAATGLMVDLPGLRSMVPGGEFQRRLNARRGRGESAYLAIAAESTPDSPALARLVRSQLDQRLFDGPSDLVVPAESVWGSNGSDHFPVEERVVLTGTSAPTHVDYFGNAEVVGLLEDFLVGSAPA